MKQLLATILASLLLTTAFGAYPRQKILLSGELLPNTPKSLNIKDIEALKKQNSIIILDPYNQNIKTHFYGIYLKDFVKSFAGPQVKNLRIGAIDGYKIDISQADINKNNLFLSFKDDSGYLSVDRMGPARIIAPVNGVINKDLLLKIGVNWVWQIRTIEFLK